MARHPRRCRCRGRAAGVGPPRPRRGARCGANRQRARDGFNMQELLFGDALAQRDFSDPSVVEGTAETPSFQGV